MTQISVGTFRTTDRMRELVDEVLDSGRISYGPKSRQFEAEFAGLHGCGYGVLSNSGTSALQVALAALKELHGWPDGAEVIVPALTFVATVSVVLHCRLTPVLVDVERTTYGIDASLIEAAITPATVAILPVHLFGQPCDMAVVKFLAERHGLAVVEDSCETVGATLHEQPVGSWGDVGCFSFYVAHHIVAGVGGMSTTSNPDLARLMRSLVNHGIDVSELPQGEAYDPSWLSRKFRFVRPGHSFRVTELEAALGLAALEEWPNSLYLRSVNARSLTRLLRPYEDWLQLPETRRGATHSWMMYPIVLRHQPKEAMMDHLRRAGIECREMVPLIRQPAFRGLWNPDDYPAAGWIERGGFYVGCHQDMELVELLRVAEAIIEYTKEPVS